jgi:hypothetical protein
MDLDPKVWGPHYWFFLHTVALTYPQHPNDVTKKKYYEFIQNMPLFIPNKNIGNNFSNMIDKYPVTPYLDSRQSFQKWMHFIHNKINKKVGVPELSYSKSIDDYYCQYKPKQIVHFQKLKKKEKIIFLATIMILFIIIYYIYKK